MSKQTRTGKWHVRGLAQMAALGVLLLAAGLAHAQDAANAQPAPTQKEATDKPEVVVEMGPVPALTSQPNAFKAQQILDAQVTPVLCTRRRWVWFENGTIVPRDAKTATLKFDVSFDTFRHDFSHSAAWVFFKVRTEGSSDWQAVRLVADPPPPGGSGVASKVMNPAGYGCEESNAPIDLMVPGGDDGFTGMFIRLADQSPETTLKAKGVTAVWDFTSARLSSETAPEQAKGFTKDTKVEMRVFAIRMMYVAKGPYWLGSGGNEMYGFYQYTDGKQDALPFKVTGPGAIPTGKQPGRLWARGAEPEDGGEIPATFPNGFSAFYCMTSPLEHGEYAAYLNALSPAEAEKRYVDDPAGAKNYQGMVSRIGEAASYVYIQAGHRKGAGIWNLSYLDAALYSAWAGLRPMTELEYEKALRGFRDPLPDESGYSYWGMNFGGGIYNNQPRMRMVSVIEADSRKFRGTHGLGTLALPADWPQKSAVGVTTRGGWGATDSAGFQNIFRTSDRHMSNSDPERRAGFGWRAVRTAPIEAEWNTARDEHPEATAKIGT